MHLHRHYRVYPSEVLPASDIYHTLPNTVISERLNIRPTLPIIIALSAITTANLTGGLSFGYYVLGLQNASVLTI